ncbi:glu leu phe val dehydrogenase family [Fusarium napiforme]|uniref:Glu leu phe val dehydrogenase family n=1 Tax=Fusarium napiforme TaxID=42672 RepID=A0A8H5JPX7_9HYPO|nr:glu leu phe val dehydrogenase family [Fusarium napiforme]
MTDTAPKKVFHEEMLGFTHIRTFTVNAGSAPEVQDDGLMHVMGLPQDQQRVLILTGGLTPTSIFSRLLGRKSRSFVHHIAMEVKAVDPLFTARERGWTTTASTPSIDLATGFRQFFLSESETGTTLEFIERRDSAEAFRGACDMGGGNESRGPDSRLTSHSARFIWVSESMGADGIKCQAAELTTYQGSQFSCGRVLLPRTLMSLGCSQGHIPVFLANTNIFLPTESLAIMIFPFRATQAFPLVVGV